MAAGSHAGIPAIGIDTWCVLSAVAAYRNLSVRAYLNGGEISRQGRKIACSSAAAIGGCAVVASSFPFGDCVEATPERGFRRWLRSGPALTLTEWAGHGNAPTERAAIGKARRERVETVESG